MLEKVVNQLTGVPCLSSCHLKGATDGLFPCLSPTPSLVARTAAGVVMGHAARGHFEMAGPGRLPSGGACGDVGWGWGGLDAQVLLTGLLSFRARLGLDGSGVGAGAGGLTSPWRPALGNTWRALEIR